MATEQLSVIFGVMNKFVERIAIGVTLATHGHLVSKPAEGGTPVDTGWARSNWVPRMGKPFEGTAGSRPDKIRDFNAHAVGMSATIVGGKIDEGPQKDGVASISGYRLGIGNLFVTNNVPYIGRLNAGSSKQAPRGFVERAILRAITEDLKKGLKGTPFEGPNTDLIR